MSAHDGLGPIGIIGGGQLGRMLALAAGRCGLDAYVYSPEAEAPAARVAARAWTNSYDDERALTDFARCCAVVTFEFENIPVAALRAIEEAGGVVRPGILSLETARDRVREKRLLAATGADIAPFMPVDSADEAGKAVRMLGAGILKLRYSGYDGKGQRWLAGPEEAAAAWEGLGAKEAVYERRIDFAGELSVILARNEAGQVACYECAENVHSGGTLQHSRVPAAFPPEVCRRAMDQATALAGRLQHIGVLAVEFFVMADGGLIANEFAPRVHNSGHWTEDVCVTGQFEQHVRAICGWPLGATRRFCDVVMENVFGVEAESIYQRSHGDAVLWLYGKREAHAGRKMGHITHLTRMRARDCDDVG